MALCCVRLSKGTDMNNAKKYSYATDLEDPSRQKTGLQPPPAKHPEQTIVDPALRLILRAQILRK